MAKKLSRRIKKKISKKQKAAKKPTGMLADAARSVGSALGKLSAQASTLTAKAKTMVPDALTKKK